MELVEKIGSFKVLSFKCGEIYVRSLTNVTNVLSSLVEIVCPKLDAKSTSLAFLMEETHRAELLTLLAEHTPNLLRLIDLVRAVDAPLPPLVNHEKLFLPAVVQLFSLSEEQATKFNTDAFQANSLSRTSLPDDWLSSFPDSIVWTHYSLTAAKDSKSIQVYKQKDLIRAGIYLAIPEFDLLDSFRRFVTEKYKGWAALEEICAGLGPEATRHRTLYLNPDKGIVFV